MKNVYRKPNMEVRLYKLPYNSVFTDSGDRNDDDNYNVTVNSGRPNMDESIFGD